MAKKEEKPKKEVLPFLLGKYETTRIGFLRLHLSRLNGDEVENSVIDLNADRQDWEGLIEEIQAIVDNMEDEEDDEEKAEEED